MDIQGQLALSIGCNIILLILWLTERSCVKDRKELRRKRAAEYDRLCRKIGHAKYFLTKED